MVLVVPEAVQWHNSTHTEYVGAVLICCRIEYDSGKTRNTRNVNPAHMQMRKPAAVLTGKLISWTDNDWLLSTKQLLQGD